MMRICVIIMSKFIIILSKDMDRLKKYETGIVGSFFAVVAFAVQLLSEYGSYV